MPESREPQRGRFAPLAGRPPKLDRLIGEIALPSAQLQEQVRSFAFPSQRLLEAAREIGESIERQWREAIPPNWSGLSAREIDRILAFSEEAGVNTVWVPRLEIVRELVAAGGADEIRAVLAAREAVVASRVPPVLGVTVASTHER